MLRALLVLVALALVAGIALVATGVVSLQQTQSAQAPAFDLKVRKVELGTETTNVTVPTVTTTTKQVERPALRLEDGNSAQ